MEALRRYVNQLKVNEKNKNLSTDSKEVFEREINRIYTILYDNLLINKLYEFKTENIKIDRNDFLNFYLSKVKASYDRYYQDPDVFIEELTTTVGSANYYGSYGSGSNSIEDVFYIPTKDLDEKFFYVTHIVINLTETQIQKINELKEEKMVLLSPLLEQIHNSLKQILFWIYDEEIKTGILEPLNSNDKEIHVYKP